MTYSKYGRLMFSEFDGDGGGEGEGATASAAEPSQAPTQATLDPKAFAQEFGSVIASQFKEQRESQPKTYSPEEIAAAKKSLNYYDITPEFMQKFGNLETQQKALEDFRDGVFNQSRTVVQAMLEQERQNWEAKFQPVQQMLSAREESAREERFHTKYPTLKNPELRPVIGSIAQKLAEQGAFQGKSEEESFTILGRGIEKVFQATNPAFKLESTPAPTNSGRSSNAISPTSHGSGGGGGNAGGSQKLSTAASILGAVRPKKS